MTLAAPGNFEILDRFGDTSLFKTISSLKVRPASNVAQKIWAYLTVQDAIKFDQKSNTSLTSNLAYEASLEQNFLTPYTDAIFADQGKDTDDNVPFFSHFN